MNDSLLDEGDFSVAFENVFMFFTFCIHDVLNVIVLYYCILIAFKYPFIPHIFKMYQAVVTHWKNVFLATGLKLKVNCSCVVCKFNL